MKQKTKLEYYKCTVCGEKQIPSVGQCPVLFVDVIDNPKQCVCGSNDFDAHVIVNMNLSRPVDHINVTVNVGDL